ncbi:MAG TPA: DUF2950 family protein, partial [Bryobacteraceae bacterium]|nr:DUF2950 family protein [Bryobacteraceae bacterium]
MISKLTRIILFGGTLLGGTALLVAQTDARKTFASPEEARDALIEAAGKGLDEVRVIFGPGAAEIVRTGDEVADKNVLKRFTQLAAEKTQLEAQEMNPDRMTLSVGIIQWPFAVPLRRKNGRWYWDIEGGKAEIRWRTIGGNELSAMEVCRGYVEAQKIYSETDWDGNGTLEYASKIVSTDGKKDGLYWPGEDSPVAAGFAKAVAEGYPQPAGTPKPYHGYFYRVLFGQGPHAAGGAQDYLVKKLMIGGFALVAWPAEYGVSGIMT